MLDLSRFNVAVFVFGMPDCPACENYMPRVKACIEARQMRGEPFRIHDPELEKTTPIPDRFVPVLFLDVSTDDKTIQDLCDRLKISGTPSTVVMLRGPGTFKVEGDIPTGNIEQILDAALERR
jgi:hypothetical protein